MEEKDNLIPHDRLMEHNQFLRDTVNRLNKANASLQEEAQRQSNRADENWKHFLDTHNALNMLNEDAQRGLTEAGTWEMRLELDSAREDVERWKDKARRVRVAYEALARRAVEAKSEESKKARDLEEALELMRQKAEKAAEERDAVAETAEENIGRLSDELERIRNQTVEWTRGRISSNEALAGITAEFTGFVLPDASTLERNRAVHVAQMTSMLNEAGDKLMAIESLITNEGVAFVNTQGLRRGHRPASGAWPCLRTYAGRSTSETAWSPCPPSWCRLCRRRHRGWRSPEVRSAWSTVSARTATPSRTPSASSSVTPS